MSRSAKWLLPSAATVPLLCVALTLAGCGIAQRIQAQEQAKQLSERSQAAAAVCNAKFPAGNAKIEVARIGCLNDALAILMPTFGSDQDLVQAHLAERMVVAEQMQNGTITIAQGNAIITEKWSQVVSESQRRQNARQSVNAQQSAAAAANTASH